MTQDEKRIRIAEAVPGWRASHGGKYCDVPDLGLIDPFRDLNACHRMENLLCGDSQKLRNDPETYNRWSVYRALIGNNIHATAAEKAEAFGQAMGLWSEPVTPETIP